MHEVLQCDGGLDAAALEVVFPSPAGMTQGALGHPKAEEETHNNINLRPRASGAHTHLAGWSGEGPPTAKGKGAKPASQSQGAQGQRAHWHY